MNLEEHYQKLANMYAAAPTNKHYEQITLSIEEGKATITLPVRDDYFHAANAMHGSYYFKLLDDSAFFAANSLVTDVFVLTSTFNLQLLRPVTKGLLRAEGKVVFQSRSLIVAEATLYNEAGKKVAFGTGNFMRSKMALSEDIGYQ